MVTRCIASWRDLNPGWQARVVDATTLHRYCSLPWDLDIERDDLTLQLISDLVRIYLLADHGGVWADASVYCAQPLDDWLPQAMNGAGFFAFQHPKSDRLLASWFLAAEKCNPLVVDVRQRMLSYFQNNRFPRQKRSSGKQLHGVFKHVFGMTPFTTRAWFSPWTNRILGIYPYFAVHYTFAVSMRGDPALYAIWQRVKPVSANLPHRLKHGRKSGVAPSGGNLTLGAHA